MLIENNRHRKMQQFRAGGKSGPHADEYSHKFDYRGSLRPTTGEGRKLKNREKGMRNKEKGMRNKSSCRS